MSSGNPEPNQDATPLARLLQLTDEDRTTLAARNINTVEEFVARQAQDPTIIHHLGLADYKAKNRVADAILFAVKQRWEVRPRAREALDSAAALTERRLRTHLPDIIVIIVLLLLGVGVYRGCSSRTALIAPRGLMPFQLIAPSDIEASGPDQRSLTAVRNEVVGKYSTVRVAPGAVINLWSLSSRTLPVNALDGRRIFRLKLQPGPLAETFSSLLPARISLMIAPKDKDVKGMLLDDIYVLDVQTQADGISAVVATTEANAQALSSFEAKSDLIIVGPVR
jgi:hypothetical protein